MQQLIDELQDEVKHHQAGFQRLAELLARLADDFVEMHDVGAIELEYWETALEVVEMFYQTKKKVSIGFLLPRGF
jgi:hypothetical protein